MAAQTAPTTATLTMDQLWASIDTAWAATNNANAHQLAVSPNPVVSNKALGVLDHLMPTMRMHLEAALAEYPLARLRAWNKCFHVALAHINKKTRMDGDDAWLYSRCFVVGAGKVYFNAFCKSPNKYGVFTFAEENLYIAMHVAEKKWGSMDALYDGSKVKKVEKKDDGDEDHSFDHLRDRHDNPRNKILEGFGGKQGNTTTDRIGIKTEQKELRAQKQNGSPVK